MPDNALSVNCDRAIRWWIEYLQVRPRWTWRLGQPQRKHIRVCSDAAGATKRIAAICYTGEKWFWCRGTVPDLMYAHFLERNDEQIAMQELLACVFAVTSFASHVMNSYVTHFCDNASALAAMINGASHVRDMNMLTGRIWLWMAAH